MMPNFYNPYAMGFNPQQNTMNNFNPTMIQGNLIKVSGRNGVDALNISPNATVVAVDSTEPVIWLINTDSAGYKTPIKYTISQCKDELPVPVEFEQRLARLEEFVNDYKSTTETSPATKRTKSSTNSTD